MAAEKHQQFLEETLSFQFPEGLYGLEEYRRYRLLLSAENLPFAYLQAEEEPNIRLLITDPFVFFQDYQFELSPEDLEALRHPEQRAVAVWVTVSAKESLQEATANLLAPLVLNMDQGIGRQVVLHNSSYSVRTPLFPPAKEER